MGFSFFLLSTGTLAICSCRKLLKYTKGNYFSTPCAKLASFNMKHTSQLGSKTVRSKSVSLNKSLYVNSIWKQGFAKCSQNPRTQTQQVKSFIHSSDHILIKLSLGHLQVLGLWVPHLIILPGEDHRYWSSPVFPKYKAGTSLKENRTVTDFVRRKAKRMYPQLCLREPTLFGTEYRGVEV